MLAVLVVMLIAMSASVSAVVVCTVQRTQASTLCNEQHTKLQLPCCAYIAHDTDTVCVTSPPSCLQCVCYYTHTHTAQQIAAGSIQTAYELAQYASSMLQRVCGGMHIDFCAALDAQLQQLVAAVKLAALNAVASQSPTVSCTQPTLQLTQMRTI
eukprot:8296-Heterococcus_DN1.PRE.4